MKKHLAVGIAAALTTAGLLQAPAQADPSPSSAAGADWLAAEVAEYNLFEYPPFDDTSPPAVDHGVNIDAGFAMLYGGDRAAAVSLRDELEPIIDGYITGEAFGDTGSTYASPLGKILAFVERTDGDSADFGGKNLVTRLEAQVNAQGKIFDTSEYGDSANAIGQAFAAQGLRAAGSDKAPAVLSYLLDQQCADGHFALGMPADAAECESSAGVDVTALVAIALRSQANQPAVATAMKAAAGWVAGKQRTDGSIAGAPPTDTPNANTTGLGAWLLGTTCDLGAANRAAAWVRELQVTSAQAGTALADEVGAIAYDQAALTQGETNGIGTTTAQRDQWRRSTAQAAVGLGWHGSLDPTVTLTGPSGFQRAGTRATYTIQGLTADDQLPCFTTHIGTRMLTGTSVTVTLPVRTSIVRYGATTGPGLSSLKVVSLAAKRLAPSVRATVRRGKNQYVRVTGLAAGETVRVVDNGRAIATGKANASGVYAKYYRLNGVGAHQVRVTGQYGNRAGSASFRVVR